MTTALCRKASAPFSNETTSRAAARSIKPELSRLELTVYELIRVGWTYDSEPFPGGQTCEECEIRSGLPHTTVSARIRGLFLKGKIQDSGYKRPTKSGRLAIIWEVTRTETQTDFKL